jgi:hypothetical protein
MPSLLQDLDPDGLLEYSVVFTDRSLNSMSRRFQGVMTDISAALKRAYKAHSVIVIPGGGTYGMEAIARQFGDDEHVMIIRMAGSAFAGQRLWRRAGLPPERQCLPQARSMVVPTASHLLRPCQSPMLSPAFMQTGRALSVRRMLKRRRA